MSDIHRGSNSQLVSITAVQAKLIPQVGQFALLSYEYCDVRYRFIEGD